MSRRPQYADSSAYSGKFRQLQQRALATMRTKVQQVLRQASEQVSAVCVNCWCLPGAVLTLYAWAWPQRRPAREGDLRS